VDSIVPPHKRVTAQHFQFAARAAVSPVITAKPWRIVSDKRVVLVASHIGYRIADSLRASGLRDELIVLLVSAMPVVELRGGVPIALWMGMPLGKAMALAIAGNMLPIPLILLALRIPFVRKVFAPVLKRAEEKSKEFSDEKGRFLALAGFVGIPLPGTGAWTGAMGAYLMNMPFQQALLSIFIGVVVASVIMAILTVTGKVGAILASAAVIAAVAANFRKK
jgi:uncharacterized membrane protein